ncbi:hypothetical protein [Pedobacter sp. UYP30]|uniref:hypothetical protein n=1 Tax=Pedobacter sp. UYP30 TaxID=1756400 RepID=UPI0033973730
MMYKIALLFLLILPIAAKAQTVTTGTVYDYSKKYLPLPGVVVRNLSGKEVTITSSGGKFTIPAKIGDILEFSLIGYHTDTLYLTTLLTKEIYLPVQSHSLNDVNIVGAKVNGALNNLRDSIAEKPSLLGTGGNLNHKRMNDRVGGLSLSLGYGKYRRQQLAERRIEEKEKYLDQITENFSSKAISEFIKLSEKEMEDFMVLYRPSVEKVMNDQPFNYSLYIARSIGAWKKLSPAERTLKDLPKIQQN